jgi:tyrosyl-tRNA synthetase
MEAKIALGKSIVTDFHSAEDAQRAADVFNSVVRRGEVPEDLAEARVPEEARVPAGIRVAKLLAAIGLADSVSDATRKINAGAVEIDGERVKEPTIPERGQAMVIRAGKNWRKVLP